MNLYRIRSAGERAEERVVAEAFVRALSTSCPGRGPMDP